MGIWIELGVFLLVFVFAAWQFYDLRREKERRLARQHAEAASSLTPIPTPSTEPFRSATASIPPIDSSSPIASSSPNSPARITGSVTPSPPSDKA